MSKIWLSPYPHRAPSSPFLLIVTVADEWNVRPGCEPLHWWDTCLSGGFLTVVSYVENFYGNDVLNQAQAERIKLICIREKIISIHGERTSKKSKLAQMNGSGMPNQWPNGLSLVYNYLINYKRGEAGLPKH